MDPALGPSPPKECSHSTCHKIIPGTEAGIKQYKTCEDCRARDAAARKRKRQNTKAAAQAQSTEAPPTGILVLEHTPNGHKRQRTLGPMLDDSDDEFEHDSSSVMYKDSQSLFEGIRACFKDGEVVEFYGCYSMPVDPLVSDKERVEMTVNEIWKVTGYRFTVKDHARLQRGHRTRLWCSQDQDRKKKEKPKPGPDVKHRDNVGMTRYACNSKLIVSCAARGPATTQTRTVTIRLHHHKNHQLYYDVALPPDAAALIRENLEWSTPVSITPKVQALYSYVTPKQVHFAWTQMSETLWKRDKMQLPSAKLLLKEFPDEVEVFNVEADEGVEQLAWGMKKILEGLKGNIVEIGNDATYSTNSKNLELYSVMAEHDNAGFPLSYCLLSTATALHIRKRRKALNMWAKCLREKYGVIPKFAHTDKDMAEIGMIRDNWELKLQLCWWHMKDAIKKRLAKAKLSTSPYNAERAHNEFSFIDKSFIPPSKADPAEHEGGEPDEVEVKGIQQQDRPNAITVRIPLPPSMKLNTGAPKVPVRTTILHDHINTYVNDISSALPPTPPTMPEASRMARIKLLPPRPTDENGNTKPPRSESVSPDRRSEEPDEDERRTFCPLELRAPIIKLVEGHFCAHPLIPGYSAPTPKGIREWAVKQMYEFCYANDLQEVWAYLWENWYRTGRWEIWARSCSPEIPILKTTMILESHWRRIKKDFLHHFHKPRLDLLTWILVVKLAPTYYRKLDLIVNSTGRFRELPCWRKQFKREWKKLASVPITMPLNDKYRPDPCKWVCTCPAFVRSRFLMCKHLIQAVQPVPPTFFLEVKRSRTLPFWQHATLVPLEGTPSHSHPAVGSTDDGEQELGAEISDDDEDDAGNIVDMEPNLWEGDGSTYHERLTDTIATIRDFCDGLDYQRQFEDRRMLEVLEREGASFLRLARACLTRERRMNTTRGSSPTTWEQGGSNAMWYRTRPRRVDINT